MSIFEDEIDFAFSDEKTFDLPISLWEEEQENEINKPKSKKSGNVKINWNVWEIQLFFTPYQAASVILDLDPYQQRNDELNQQLKAIAEILKQYTEEGYLKQSRVEKQTDDVLGDVKAFKIYRDDLLYFSNNILKIPLTLKSLPDFKQEEQEQSTYSNKRNYKEETLREFIELIIDPSLLEINGELPSYSRLHTKLQHKYPNRRITSKNTIKKLLNDL